MLFVGDDWAEDHHDVELMDAGGKVLAKARLPEGVVHGGGFAQIGKRDEKDAGDREERAERQGHAHRSAGAPAAA